MHHSLYASLASLFGTLAIFAFTALLVSVPIPKPIGSFTTKHQQSHIGIRKHGAVASESRLCTDIGITFLDKGGNAADALIATGFCLGVVAMYHVGIGGGGFMLVRGSNGQYETIDFKETAPAAAFQDMFVNNSKAAEFGGLASGVSGELRGLAYLHRHYGSLPWIELMQPAIKLARDGFVIGQDFGNYLNLPDQDFLRTDPAWAIDFAPNGTLKAVGELLTRKRYADTLEKISKQGVDIYYTGELATTTIQAIQRANGTMTLADLRGYQAIGKPAIKVKYRNFTLIADDLPAGGTQVLSIMRTLEGYENIGQTGHINISTHHVIEAVKFSFGERRRLGDPKFVDGANEIAQEMLSEAAATQRRSKISDTHTLDPGVYDPSDRGSGKDHGTTAAVTADEDGLTIAWTSTVNGFWGSRVCVPESGIIMNNIMGDFTIPNSTDLWGLPGSSANYPQPGKKAQDSVTNLMVEHLHNGSIYMVTATAGSAHIVTTGVQMLWFVLDRELSVVEASKQPRLHNQLHPNNLELHYSYDNETAAFLRDLGHNVSYISPYSVNHAILRRWDGSFGVASEPYLENGGGATN